MLLDRRGLFAGATGALLAATAVRAAEPAPVVLGTFGGIFDTALGQITPALDQQAGISLSRSVGSSQIVLSKLQAGGARSPFDAVMMTAEAMLLASRNNLLQPVSTATLPNITQVQRRLLAPFAVPGGYCAVPLHWKVIGILWRRDLVPFEITSWRDLWRPELRNRISVQNMPTLGAASTLIAAAIVNGGSQHDLEPGWKAMTALRPNIRDFYTVSSNALAALVSGETWATVNVVDLGLPLTGQHVVATVPREGCGYSPEGMGVASHGKEPAAAMRMIDTMLAPAQQLAWAAAAKVCPSTSVALPADLRQSIVEDDAVLARLFDIDFLDMGLKMRDWSERWQQDVVG